MTNKFLSLDALAVGCVVIAGIVEAAQQALSVYFR